MILGPCTVPCNPFVVMRNHSHSPIVLKPIYIQRLRLQNRSDVTLESLTRQSPSDIAVANTVCNSTRLNAYIWFRSDIAASSLRRCKSLDVNEHTIKPHTNEEDILCNFIHKIWSISVSSFRKSILYDTGFPYLFIYSAVSSSFFHPN